MHPTKIGISVLFFICFLISGSVAQSKLPTHKKENTSAYVRDLSEFVNQYAAELKPLLKRADASFFEKGENPFLTFPTYFHEKFHEYNDSMNYKKNSTRKYFFKGEITELVKTPVFNSKMLKEIIPARIKDSVSRYGIYILGENEMLTQLDVNNNLDSRQSGIYGLLEEFIAYYYNSLVYAKLGSYLKTKYSADSINIWFDYLGQRGNLINAYFEFKTFIAYYFLFADQHKPDIYKTLTNDRALLRLIFDVDKAYRLLYDEYILQRSDIIKMSKNKIFRINNYLVSTETNDRFTLPDQEIRLLTKYFPEDLESIISGAN